MTATTNINLIYFGNFASTDVSERDYNSEKASLLNNVTVDHDTLRIVAVRTTDPQHNGVINDDECDAGDRFTYTVNGQTKTATTDSTMTFQATLGLADGSTVTEEVLVVQATNGDVFISDLLDGGTIDNLNISSITLDEATGTNFSGWFSDQSVDGSSIQAAIEAGGQGVSSSAPGASAQGNGIVEGGAGDDTIDADYEDDPDGDRIDAGDAIGSVFGTAGSDDDLVDANGGDDSVDAGAGNDLVYGGAGDDTLDGGDGNDTLLGDTDVESEIIVGERAIFDWEDAPGFGSGNAASGFTQDTGDVNVTFSITENSDTDDDATDSYATNRQNTDDLDAEVSENSSFDSLLQDTGDSYTYTFDFDQTVADVEFRVNDVDGGGRVTITATGPDGPVTLTLEEGDDLDVSNGGQTVTSQGGYASDTSDDYSVLVNIAGPLTSISVLHEQINDNDSGINITDITFNPVELVLTESDAGAGNDVLIGGLGDDSIDGGAGADEVSGGAGDDELFGGAQNDTITGGDGSDFADGGTGADLIDTSGGNAAFDTDVPLVPTPLDQDTAPENDRDTVFGGAGNDTILTGDDADLIEAGSGADSVESGIDDDTVLGGAGNDTIFDLQGSDSILGGAGDDVINAGTDTFSDFPNDQPTLPNGASNPFAGVGDPNTGDGRDFVDGGSGDDTIQTGDDADTILGGIGDDDINAGIDNDDVSGGAGDDSITGSHGADTLAGDGGADTIYGGFGETPGIPGVIDEVIDTDDPETGNDTDLILGGDGDDVLFGEDDDDTIFGGADDDFIDGGIDEDSLDGGTGDDTILGGQGADTITGGAGSDSIDGGTGDDSIDGGSGDDTLDGGDDQDTFTNVNGGDSVIGGSGGTDFDVLDLTGSLNGGSYQIVDGSLTPDTDPGDTVDGDSPNDGFDGQIEFFDADGNSTGILTFENIERIIPCFTPGTLIATPKGERRVEDLREGDRVITRDNGIQEIRWIGEKRLTRGELAQQPELKPVLIRAGSLGNGLPERDMLVSPNHRMLVANDKTALYFEEREVLVAAKHLTGGAGIDQVQALGVSYIHFMFEQHEVVLSDGTWSESFQPGDYTLKGIGDAQRDEILKLFPELEHHEGIEGYQSARRTLKRHEARLLVT